MSRYVEIAGALRARIERGDLPPGARLPAQRELGREFGVTVMTVRQALALLAREGLVAARHGAGTFVAEPPVAYRLDHLESLAEQLAAQGRELETRVLAAGVEEVPEAERLGAARAYVVERLRVADGVPIALQRSLLPPATGRALARVDLAERPLSEALAALGLRIERAEETLRPVVLDGRAAGLLAVEPGTPAFASERLSRAGDGAPLLLDHALLPAGRVVVVGYRLAST